MPATLPDLTDPADPRVKAAVDGWSCDICKTPRKQLCRNRIRPGEPLPGRVIHHARLTDRRREPKEDE
ncbi:hypothetical protein GR927_20610 [Mycolicibacterium sp. 3033]|nr:hypothetical protein [Mycolicibacterium aurantiacum]